jgi:DNA-binding transcriptional MerR regulator
MVQRAPIKNTSSKKAKPFPDKLFYKIGEVSRITGVEPYVLRYWETEFPGLRPRKNRSGQRVYVKKDLEQILQIKTLLYEDKYTIEGVRKRLVAEAPREEPAAGAVPADTLRHVIERLRKILEQIS